MDSERIHRASAKVALALSLIALLTVLTGFFQAPEPDEGTGAHIFQLAVAALLPTILLFLATTDWKQPWRSVRPLALPLAALVLAFGSLYYLEHHFYR